MVEPSRRHGVQRLALVVVAAISGPVMSLPVMSVPALAQTPLAQTLPTQTGTPQTSMPQTATPTEPAVTPSLAQRIDPIVPPVRRVAPAAAQSVGQDVVRGAAPVVSGVKRGKATFAQLKRQAASAKAAQAPTPQPKAGVQAVTSQAASPNTASTSTPGTVLAPNSRSTLGRLGAAARAAKPVQATAKKVTAAARSAVARAKPKR